MNAIPNRDREGAAKPPRSICEHQQPGPFVSASEPLAYLITFPTYGTWLHGDARGSVDREHNVPGTPLLSPDPRRERREIVRLKHARVILNAGRRMLVQRTIVQVAGHRNWTIHAINVRTNHAHVVVSAPVPPERVMNDLKSWSTRAMVKAGLLAPGTKAWVRHGSTRYLWKAEELKAACQYVCEAQGPDLDAHK